MNTNPYASNTPEYRVHELAHAEPGLADEEVLTKVGYVPHDGDWMRDDLLAQYHAAEPVVRFIDGFRAHAMSWSWHGGLDTAEAYADHMVALHRRGEVDEWTSHKVEYPASLAGRQAEPVAEPGRALGDSCGACFDAACDGAHQFREADAELEA